MSLQVPGTQDDTAAVRGAEAVAGVGHRV